MWDNKGDGIWKVNIAGWAHRKRRLSLDDLARRQMDQNSCTGIMREAPRTT